jgi:hypothetical protein
MKISEPCVITPRLLPGVRIGEAFLSIEYGEWTKDGRQGYVIYLNTPTFEYTDDTLASGVGGGSLQNGLESCLAFLGVCGESVNYSRRIGRRGDNADLFPNDVASWCADNEDELGMLQDELAETDDLIIE